MKYVSSSRRQIVMTVLLALALLGAAIRYWAPNPSTARDIGTLLLVLWLPAVGNLVAFVVRQLAAHRARPPAGFDDASPFTPHLVVQVTPGAAETSSNERRCTLVAGSEGFSARTAASLWVALSDTTELPFQLMRPAVALPRLPAGTQVKVMLGEIVIAEGTVLRSGDTLASH